MFSEGGCSPAAFSAIPFIQGRLLQDGLILGTAFKTASAGHVCDSLILFRSLRWQSVLGMAEVHSGSVCKAGSDWVKFADHPGARLGSGLKL